MPAIGPVAAYEQAVANMEAAREAVTAEHLANLNSPSYGCCGSWPTPAYVAFLKACAARDEARRNLGLDAMDRCDRPFLTEAAREVVVLPPPAPSQAFPD
jgi:hypothetical protein